MLCFIHLKMFVIAMACAMAAPPTTNGGLSIEDGKNSVVKRSPAFGSGNQNVANPVVRKRRVGVIDGNGQVVDLDDDDLRFVTTDLTGRQLALTSKQNSISVANRVPVRTSFRGSGSSVGKATGHIVFVNSDDSNEMDDFDDIDDIDDLAIISSDGRIFPFANSQNGVGIISQSSALNTLTSPVAAAGRQIRMKSEAAQSKRASSSTCTCPPQREIVNLSPQISSRPMGFMQFMRFPKQRFSLPSFPGIQFVFDD